MYSGVKCILEHWIFCFVKFWVVYFEKIETWHSELLQSPETSRNPLVIAYRVNDCRSLRRPANFANYSRQKRTTKPRLWQSDICWCNFCSHLKMNREGLEAVWECVGTAKIVLRRGRNAIIVMRLLRTRHVVTSSHRDNYGSPSHVKDFFRRYAVM